MQHPFFSIRHKIAEEDRKIGCIVVTGNKGMAGAYNHNIQKMTEQFMAEHEHCKLYVLGMVGRQYFTKKHMDLSLIHIFIVLVYAAVLFIDLRVFAAIFSSKKSRPFV